MMRALTRGLFLPLLLLVPPATAHELQENRATIVLRDKIHLSMTLFISYTEALHVALAPQRPYTAFLVVYSSMKPENLQKELQKAQARFEAATKMFVSPGGELTITNWVWPDASQVQSLLQQRVMQAMVDTGAHSHEAPLEVRAEAIAKREVLSVRIRFPEEYNKVLVVAFRPNQVWVEPNSLSGELKF